MVWITERKASKGANKMAKDETLDTFVRQLNSREREIATASVALPNSPDCQPEYMALHFRYGGELSEVLEKIRHLQQKIGCNYDTLQKELQERLFS